MVQKWVGPKKRRPSDRLVNFLNDRDQNFIHFQTPKEMPISDTSKNAVLTDNSPVPTVETDLKLEKPKSPKKSRYIKKVDDCLNNIILKDYFINLKEE